MHLLHPYIRAVSPQHLLSSSPIKSIITHKCGWTTSQWLLCVHETSHPIRVWAVDARLLLQPPVLSTGADNCPASKTHKVSHTWMWHQLFSPPSLFSASHNAYSKHMSSYIQELEPWQQGQIQTILSTNIWKRRRIQCACQAGNEEQRRWRGREGGGSHFLLPFV